MVGLEKKIFEGIYVTAILTHFRSLDRHGLRNLTSGSRPNVVNQIWYHYVSWVWIKEIFEGIYAIFFSPQNCRSWPF